MTINASLKIVVSVLCIFVFAAPLLVGGELERLQKELANETEKVALNYAIKLKKLQDELTKRGDLRAALKVAEEYEWVEKNRSNWRAIHDKQKPIRPAPKESRSGDDSFTGGWSCSDGFVIELKNDGNFDRYKSEPNKRSRWIDGWHGGKWMVKQVDGEQRLYLLYINQKWEDYRKSEDGIWKESHNEKKTIVQPKGHD